MDNLYKEIDRKINALGSLPHGMWLMINLQSVREWLPDIDVRNVNRIYGVPCRVGINVPYGKAYVYIDQERVAEWDLCG